MNPLIRKKCAFELWFHSVVDNFKLYTRHYGRNTINLLMILRCGKLSMDPVHKIDIKGRKKRWILTFWFQFEKARFKWYLTAKANNQKQRIAHSIKLKQTNKKRVQKWLLNKLRSNSFSVVSITIQIDFKSAGKFN